ncbi:MAG TPA: hypothetical protein VF463_20870 [Sphingobium sp.]
MNIFRRLALILALAFTGMGLSSPASAQATRTWISGVGDDANPCSRTAPCKTFPGAISKTASGGEINCLDPGGFGGVTITKSITLKCDEASNGGVLVAATNAIIINGSGIEVSLIGLDIEGLGQTGSPGLNAINFLSGTSLTVRNCSIRNFSQNGINFAPSSNASLFVSDTQITSVGQSATYAGIQLRPTGSANIKATVNSTEITGGYFGVVADGSATTGKINGIINDSNVSGNQFNGITASIGTASGVTLILDRVSVVGNGNNGLATSGVNAGLLVGNSSIYGNQGGLFATAGGVLVSYGTNRVNGNNGNDGVFTSTIVQK